MAWSVMANVLDYCNKQVRAPIVLLRPPLDEYLWGRYELHYPPGYG